MPPVAPVKPRYTLGGNTTVVLTCRNPSTYTTKCPFSTLTATRCGPVRSAGIDASINFHCRPAPVIPLMTPIEFADVFVALGYVASPTATPGIPPKPSPLPIPPSAVGWAVAASANASVSPSAPPPPPIVATKLTLNALEETACGQNAEPAWTCSAGVSWNAAPCLVAEPFSVHLSDGGGTVA